MSVNGKKCWTKNGITHMGKAVCGQTGFKSEQRFPVACKVTLSGSGNRPLTVRVWTTLNQGANDESFGIDNVVIQKLSTAIIEQFNNPKDSKGWNCGKVQKCGNWGNICGGYGVKGQGSDIKKTFHLPAGTYSVKLAFLKIDSWFVWCMSGTGECKRCRDPPPASHSNALFHTSGTARTRT